MEEETKSTRRFFGYPKPVEAPVTPFTKSDDANPVFSGILLVIGAWLYVSFHPISEIRLTEPGFLSSSSSKSFCGQMLDSMASGIFNILRTILSVGMYVFFYHIPSN
jgi:hypothetical protein